MFLIQSKILRFIDSIFIIIKSCLIDNILNQPKNKELVLEEMSFEVVHIITINDLFVNKKSPLHVRHNYLYCSDIEKSSSLAGCHSSALAWSEGGTLSVNGQWNNYASLKYKYWYGM